MLFTFICLVSIYFYRYEYVSVDCKYHMSSSGMTELIAFEKYLANDFLRYYHEEVKRLDELEAFLDNTVDSESEDDDEDERYVSNAVNGYKLIKRFVHGWTNMTQFQTREFSLPHMKNYSVSYEKHFEDIRELRGSVYAIMKIQETYMMSASRFLDLFNSRYSQTMTLNDVFIIGYFAMTLEYFGIAQTWLLEAYKRYSTTNDTDLYPYNVTRLLESLVWSADRLTDWDTAEFHSRRLLELHPHSHEVQSKVDYYRFQSYWTKRQQGPVKRTDEEIYAFKEYNGRHWLKREYKMCRGEEKMRQRDQMKLYCKYFSPNTEFILKPLQLELASNNPKVYYFHNLLSDSEIDQIIQKARKKLSAAEVFNSYTGEKTTADYRISKIAWFRAWDNPLVRNIMVRVGRLAKLDMRYCEPMQVANYGIGGNYESHWDHATPPNNYTIFGKYGWGNRIATMLLYLSDVESGGSTVFVNTGPGVTVPAKKGAGVFWFNLKSNGDGDKRTKHAGCPVLLGEKWIANLWIHAWGQEFLRPCPLNQNHNNGVYDL